MAKDRRKKTTSDQVSLAQKAAHKGPAASARTAAVKREKTRRVMLIVMAALVALALIFVVVMGKLVYDALKTPTKKGGNVVLTSYVSTPASDRDKVAYYLVGLFGKTMEEPTDMLTMACYDKKAKTVQFLQLPQDTWLGTSGEWAAKRIADVWANPRPLNWCEACRREVKAEEIHDNKHAVETCGGPITQKRGSSTEDLLGVINKQYGLPVDGYFLFQHTSFTKLVDLLGGLDVKLEDAMTVDGIKYKTGVQTLTGAAALSYANSRKAGVDGDVARLVKQRKVFAALLERLCTKYEGFDRYSDGKLAKAVAADTVLDALMKGRDPLRTNVETGDWMRLLGALHEVPLSSMTVYMLPGGVGKSGGTSYYSPHKNELLTLLNEHFNPYGDSIQADQLGVYPLSGAKKGSLYEQKLAEGVATQAGTVATTAAPTTTAAATAATTKK